MEKLIARRKDRSAELTIYTVQDLLLSFTYSHELTFPSIIILQCKYVISKTAFAIVRSTPSPVTVLIFNEETLAARKMQAREAIEGTPGLDGKSSMRGRCRPVVECIILPRPKPSFNQPSRTLRRAIIRFAWPQCASSASTTR